MKSFLYLLSALLFLGGAAIGVIAAIDELSDPTPPAETTAANAAVAPDYPGSGRVFVLFVDSLRDKTALNPDLMPHLVALTKSATHARVETVYDAVTVPAVRAAFTGRSHFRVLGFVQNFIRHAQNLPSLFSQLKARGDRTAVFSDIKTFSQFGDDIQENLLFEGEGATTEDRQNAQAKRALALFHSGKHHLMIFHIGYVDYVAHKYGIAHENYRHDVATADNLIGEIADGISPEDTFVVFGDHGHTETGRHALGLDVPTFIALRGPGFKPGVDLGLVHITTYRYLLSWALKLPLAPDYTRDRYPEAFVLAADETVPPSYALIQEAGAVAAPAHGLPSRTGPLSIFIVLAMAVGALFALWWAVGEIIYAGGTRNFDLKTFFRRLVLAVVLAVPVMGIGVALASLRSFIHEPFYPTIYQVWGGVLLVMLVLVRRFDLGVLGLIVLGVPFLVLWPTTYRYGAPGVFAPAWFLWATCAYVLSFGFKGGLPTAKYALFGKWRVRKSTLLFFGIIFLVQPFFFTDASNFDFTEFKALSPEIVPTALWAQAVTGALATAILFLRPKGGWKNGLLTLTFVLYFLAIFFHVIPEGALGNFFFGVFLLLAATVIRRKFRLGFLHADSQGVVRSLFLAALVVFYFYFVRVSSELRLDAMMLFAALRLSVLMLDQLPVNRRSIRWNALFLQIIGLIVAGWVTLCWNVSNVEWYAAYDFFPPKIVEEYVWLFLPFIVLKFSLPVLISRTLIVERVKLEREYPAKELALFAGFKFATLILLTLGLGYYTSGSNVYLEATGELAIFMTLAAGLF